MEYGLQSLNRVLDSAGNNCNPYTVEGVSEVQSYVYMVQKKEGNHRVVCACLLLRPPATPADTYHKACTDRYKLKSMG